jgi:hypothetical protein
MQNQSASDVAGINARNRMDVANVGEAGANFRTGLTTSTQKSIADQSLGLEREKLAQQSTQFGQTIGLDRDKFNESSFQGRLGLTKPITTYDGLGGKTSSPGINFSDPKQTNVMTDDELRQRRAAIASGNY